MDNAAEVMMNCATGLGVMCTNRRKVTAMERSGASTIVLTDYQIFEDVEFRDLGWWAGELGQGGGWEEQGM